jgi:lactoylglutathione lyase
MDLGAFSISLTVKDINASREFYEKLGFEQFGGDISQNWLIMKSGDAIVGLFEGMFERNMLTFNPGWSAEATEVDPFTDVRELRRRFQESGLELSDEAGEGSEGPASFIVTDPDGNPILFDQHR